jgi:Tfp pilus assembly protein PilX
MAGVYRADNLAFQAAEAELRGAEAVIVDDNPLLCEQEPTRAPIPTQWSDGSETAPDSGYENMNKPSPLFRNIGGAGSVAAGSSSEVGGATCLTFRVSAYSLDNPAAPTARAIVQSFYVPTQF